MLVKKMLFPPKLSMAVYVSNGCDELLLLTSKLVHHCNENVEQYYQLKYC